MTGPHRSDRLHRGLTEQLRSPHINASVFRRTGMTYRKGRIKSDWLEQPVWVECVLEVPADTLSRTAGKRRSPGPFAPRLVPQQHDFGRPSGPAVLRAGGNRPPSCLRVDGPYDRHGVTPIKVTVRDINGLTRSANGGKHEGRSTVVEPPVGSIPKRGAARVSKNLERRQ